MSLTQVSTGGIKDGTISNADLDASAAIDGSKVSPDFGSQNITTTGTVTGASLVPSSSTVPTNGVYLPAANTVGLSTNGTGRLFVDASGRLGVPFIGEATATFSKFYSEGNAPTVLITNPGNHAWGTALQIATTGGSDNPTLSLENHNSGSPNRYGIKVSSAGDLLFASGAYSDSPGTERLRITSAGLVGIGTSSASTGLRLVSAPQATSDYFNHTIASFESNTSDGLAIVRTGAQQIGLKVNTARSFVVGTEGASGAFTERLRVDDQGRLGIGTTTPAELFDVNGKAIIRNALGVGGANYGSSGQVLTSQGSGAAPQWASISSGKVLQVVQTVKSDTFSAASTSFVDITGYAATITPSSSSNKVLVIVEAKLSNSGLDSSMLLLLRGSTAIYVGDTSGNRVRASGTTNFSREGIETVMCIFLDSPATTSGVTYKTQIRSQSGTAYLNRSAPDGDNAIYARTASSITLMEIAS